MRIFGLAIIFSCSIGLGCNAYAETASDTGEYASSAGQIDFAAPEGSGICREICQNAGRSDADCLAVCGGAGNDTHCYYAYSYRRWVCY